MYDYFGRTLKIGDYIFGGTLKPAIWKIIGEDDKGLVYYGRIAKIGERVDIRAYLCDFMRISEEDMMLYLLNQGYKDGTKKDKDMEHD